MSTSGSTANSINDSHDGSVTENGDVTGTVTNSLRSLHDSSFNSAGTGDVTNCIRRSFINPLSESDADSHCMERRPRMEHSEQNTHSEQQSNENVSEEGNSVGNNSFPVFLDRRFNINESQFHINSTQEQENEMETMNETFMTRLFNETTYELSDDENDGTNEYLPAHGRLEFSHLYDLFQIPDYADIIEANFVVNKIEVLLAIVTFVKQFSLPMDAFVQCCKMFNSFFNVAVVPSTRYFIDKLFYPKEGIDYHAVCPQCKSYVGTFSKNQRYIACTVCQLNVNLKSPSYRDYFVVLDVQMEIKNLIETNSTFYHSVVSRCNEAREYVEDIFDGMCYKKFIASLPPHERNSYATVTFNSDGSPTFKSSKFAIWPIQMNINEVPLCERNKPITFALWFGHDKPNMTTFLKPFVAKLNELSAIGISCKINNEERTIKLYALCCCVDSVARAPMQGMVQFNGYYGCNWCLHSGVMVRYGRGQAMKYPILNEEPQLRTEETTLVHLQETLQTGFPNFGVKNATPLLNLKGFHIINGFVPDSMHCINLGIVKKFSEYWFDSSGHPYSLSKQQINRLDNFATSLKVPSNLARLSRSIKDRKYWKSREWENWLLFYSLPLLNVIYEENPPFKQYFDHWAMLVRAFYILSENCINTNQIRVANRLLRQFVALTEILYGQYAMTYNMHQLLHIAQSVANWGPLWAHNGYPFESGNGQLLRTVYAANGVIDQVCRNICMKKSIIILNEHVKNYNANSPVLQFTFNLTHRQTEKSVKLNECRYFGVPVSPTVNIVQEYNLSQTCKAYHRLIKNGSLFQSNKKILLRSNNSFAVTDCSDYIEIVEFLVDDANNLELTVCKKINVAEAFSNSCTNIKKIVNIEQNMSIVETKAIERICIHMTVGNHCYISALPNMHLFS